MTKLTAKTRDDLSNEDFALPGRRYPIHDENHARDALAMVAKYGSPGEQATVRSKVKRRYPNIDVEGGSEEKNDADTDTQ